MFEHAIQLIKNPSVASVGPTRPYCAKRIANLLDYERASTIVEYGPAEGALTRYLLPRMRPDAKLIAIETNEPFVKELKNRIPDPRLMVVNDSAANIAAIQRRLGLPSIDYVVSGIPFSFFDPGTKQAILHDTAAALKQDGRLILYQAHTAVGGKRALERALSGIFAVTGQQNLLFNIPPLYVIEAVPLTFSLSDATMGSWRKFH